MKSETVPLAMPPELLSQVRKAAKLTGLSMADVMRHGIKLGVPKLIEVAQTNHNREVRKQAMFWLGQSHDPRALAFFEKILTQ